MVWLKITGYLIVLEGSGFFQQPYQSNLFTKFEITKYWFGSIARVLPRQNEERILAQIWVCTGAQEQKGASFWFLV